MIIQGTRNSVFYYIQKLELRRRCIKLKKQIVKNSKENWRKVLNELESELNVEYSIAILDMYDGKEERYNKAIADLHEILDVFIQEKENERSLKY